MSHNDPGCFLVTFDGNFKGHGFNVFARCQLSIFTLHSILQLEARDYFVKLYHQEVNRYSKTKMKPGYEWLLTRRQTKRKSKLQTLFR